MLDQPGDYRQIEGGGLLVGDLMEFPVLEHPYNALAFQQVASCEWRYECHHNHITWKAVVL